MNWHILTYKKYYSTITIGGNVIKKIVINFKQKKGFTLIELLAVIIILGVLMIIAIPSITNYISESRKQAYITIASGYISGARNKVNSGDISAYEKDVTYYIPGSCISLEKGGDSPYGKFIDYYIVVTYDGNGYNYYWTSRDETNTGIYLTYEGHLDTDSIMNGVNKISTNVGVGDRKRIKIIQDSCTVEDAIETESSINIVDKGILDNDFNLIYHTNGGGTCESKKLVIEEKYGELCTPIKSGYEFMGWYSEPEFLNAITKDTIFTGEFIDLYAKWNANGYTVTFDANGGSVSGENIVVSYDDYYGTLPVPTQNGHAFSGWYTEIDGGTKVTETSKVNIAQDHTLYAHWTKCLAGTYVGEDSLTCTTCPTGYTSVDGANSINECYIEVSEGKYIGTANSTTQNLCAAGTYKEAHTVNYGSTSSCTNCPSGYTSNAGATAQNKCYINVAAGKYIGTANSTTQSTCPAGKYKEAHTVNYGSTSSCTNCPSGYTSNAGATAQNKCYINVAAGKYIGTANSTTQSTCPAGKYKEAHTVNYGSTSSCTNCPSGYTSNAGATAQNKCYINVAAGKYIGTANSATQSTCPAGKYKGAHTVNYGSISSCTTCAAGTYSTGGAASCSICPSGYTSSTGATSINSCYTTLTYNNNGGMGCTNKPINYGGTYGTLCVPTRSNYAFLGWHTAANGGTQITATSSVGTTANPTLYAHWQMLDTQKPTINSITVSGGAPNLTITVNATDDGTIASYEFSGLNNQTYKSNGTNKTYTITGAAAGGTYTVYVRVKDTTGKYRVGYVQVTSNAQEECEKFYSTCNGAPCLDKYEPQGWFYCGYYTLDIWYVFCRNCVAAGTYRITSYNYQAG